MLDGIRANAQSWAVKVAFALIIIVFVFWGIGGNPTPKTVVATVNGMNITEMEYRQAYGQMVENLRRQYPGMTETMLRDLRVDQGVLEQLVQQRLLEADGQRTGIAVSPYELRRLFESIPQFAGEDGKFSRDAYVAALAAQGRTPAQFEEAYRLQLLPEKVMQMVGAGAYVLPAVARERFNYQSEQRAMDYLFFPAAPHEKAAAPTEEEILKGYEARQNLFAVPARIRAEYITLDPAALSDPAAVSDADLQAAYQENIARYSLPEKLHARHILVRVPENAPEAEVKKAEDVIRAAEARIKAGEDFAAVAAQVGQDGTAANGGDLGWFERGQMVPAFADAAFALKPGEMSGPVRTQFGFHLIKAEGHEDARVMPLDEVRDELRASLATQRAADGLRAKADAVLAAAMSGKSMEEVAAASHLEMKSTALASVDAVAGELSLGSQDAKLLASTPAGTVLDSPVPSGSALMIVRVAESLPAMTRPLDEVREDVVVLLTREKSRQMALEDAEKARAAFVDNKPAAGAGEVKRSALFDRSGAVPDLGMNTDLVRALYAPAAPADAWLPGAYIMNEGAVLARLAEVALPDDATWEAQRANVENALLSGRMENLFEMYQFLLRRDAKVLLTNPNMFQRQEAAGS